MFKLEFFCEDKDLAGIMHALAGRAKNLDVMPVADATVQRSGNKVTAKAGNTLALIVEELKKRRLESFKAADMKAVVRAVGYNPTSYNHFIKELVKIGAIGKLGKGSSMTYTVKS